VAIAISAPSILLPTLFWDRAPVIGALIGALLIVFAVVRPARPDPIAG
jgi:hypothetical protein